MSRMTLLDRELWLGGGQARMLLFGKSPETGYPPYNIELVAKQDDGPDVLRITLAVAGFALEDLSLTVENGQLVVRGQRSDEREREFIYRGIAARRFKRSFGLANGVEVQGAHLHNGLLVIELVRPVRSAQIRTVQIGGGEHASPAEMGLSARRARVRDAEEIE